MSRTIESVERDEAYLKEEKKFVKAEEAFRVKKAAGKVTTADKLKLRELRQDWRLNYRKGGPGTVSPDTIGTAATQGEAG